MSAGGSSANALSAATVIKPSPATQQQQEETKIEESNKPTLNDILTKWSSDPLNETLPLVHQIADFSEKNLKIFIEFITALEAYRNFILNCELYRNKIQIDKPTETELLDIISQQPFQYFDYQLMVFQNYLTYNGYVRGDYFEDLKTVAPYQQKEIRFQMQLFCQKMSYFYRKFQRNQKKWFQLRAVQFGTVESSEIVALKIDNLNQLIEERMPTQGKQLFYQAVSYFTGFLEESNKERIVKYITAGSQQVDEKLTNLGKKKEQIQERIKILKEQQEQQKSVEKISEIKKAEVKRIEDLHSQQSLAAEVAFQKDQQFAWRSREENRLKLLKINESIVVKDEQFEKEVRRQQQQNETDAVFARYSREQERIERVEMAKKQLKEQLLEEDEKAKQKKLEKEKELNFIEKRISEKQKTQEVQFAEKLVKIESDKMEEMRIQQKASRKQELLNFEQSLIAQEEKNQQLLKLKKKIPAKKPEQVALEQSLMEELKQIRIQEEAEETERLRLEELAVKLAKKTFQEKIGEKIQQKQDRIYEKALEINQSISNFGLTFKDNLTLEPIKAAGRFVGANIGEMLLWSTSIVSTLFFGPLDNLKLLNQLGAKGSEFARKDFSEKAKIYKPIQKPDPAAKIADQVNSIISQVKKEPNTATKGNLIRLLKHNILGSDLMSLAFFKITQDNLMMYTQGTYQNYNNFIAGAVSGAILGFLMNPIDLFKTLYVATDLKLQFQLKNLKFLPYKGLMPNVYSNALFRGMQFSLYELLKKRIYKKEYSITQDAFAANTSYKNYNSYNHYLSIGQKYAAAVSAMFVSSVVAYPLDTAKRYIFADIYSGMSNNRLTSISQALAIYGNWYGGFKYQCYKIALQPLSLILWDHLASKLCSKSQIHNNFY